MMQLIQDAKVKDMKQAVLEKKALDMRSVIKVVPPIRSTSYCDDDYEEDKMVEREEEEELEEAPVKYKKGGGGGGLMAKFGSFFKKADSGPVPIVTATAPLSREAAAPPQSNAEKPVDSGPKPDEAKKPEDAAPPPSDGVEGDVSLMPKLIESQLEQYDEEGAVRPTIINLGQVSVEGKKTHEEFL